MKVKKIHGSAKAFRMLILKVVGKKSIFKIIPDPARSNLSGAQQQGRVFTSQCVGSGSRRAKMAHKKEKRK
jgi:hypothetical protein